MMNGTMNVNRNDLDESTESNGRKRKQSSFRYIDADLNVILGRVPIGENRGDENPHVYWYFSQVLVSQRRYVDTLLSTSLSTYYDKNPSKDHKEITFPDITPSQWERMM
jgi:hypothetical protein